MVAAVSEFTRQEVINHFSFPENRIRVVYNGFNPLPPLTCEHKEAARVVESPLLPKPYLLFAGALDPRKNIERLIEALAQCRQAEKDFPDLVIAGVSTGEWNRSRCARKARKLGVSADIHLCGVVDRDALTRLMQKAHGLCYPSLYEGFGFPPLEAMSLGVPVLAARSSSIPEVSGSAACLVDPMSVDDMARGLSRIVFDHNYRESLIKRVIAKSKSFLGKEPLLNTWTSMIP